MQSDEGRNSAVGHSPWDGGAGLLPRGLGGKEWAGVSTGIFVFGDLFAWWCMKGDSCLHTTTLGSYISICKYYFLSRS
jgi:hypothetical protein